MLTQEPLRYRKHLLPNLAGKVLRLLTVWVNPKSLRYVAAEMSLLMVPRILELARRGSECYHHDGLSVPCIGVGNAGIQIAGAHVPESVHQVCSPATDTAQV